MTAANYRRALWFLAAVWILTAMFGLRDVSLFGVLAGFTLGSLTVVAFRFSTWDRDRRGGPFVIRDDFWVAVVFPTLVVLSSLMAYREQPPPGIVLGISAASGLSTALAGWFSWKWRTSASDG